MKKHYLIDLDGVLVHGSTMIPGADRFIERLKEAGVEYLVLTNNPTYAPSDLSHRLRTIGMDVPTERIFTSAMATARFLHSQRPGGTAFVLGESGLITAIHSIGYVITDLNPDYVVLGEGSFQLDMLTKAIRLIRAGARFIATNPDVSGPGEGGLWVPACGAMAAFIEKASGVPAYFVGKPNPLMMRTALNYLNVHSEETIMVGDNMATDIKGGVESGMETILVLTGVTRREEVARYPYQPTRIVESVADIIP
ncbi:MAG: HAD-IIA family hydrolase [Anaerolineae bacterium]|nr:HAD-IIA family hydrolase [Caldilineales bacterium]MCX7853198.1 HAD-IIA family hydrolase [Caldilineales bacterium]MDW8269987.1 HAD-IIA family hydrolase [Anaerolineae bacterium]